MTTATALVPVFHAGDKVSCHGATVLADLRASLLAGGWTAESPASLAPEAETIARAERADYTD